MILLRMLSNFFSKKCCLFDVLTRWVNSRGLHPLQPVVQPPASRRTKRVNGEEVRDFNLLFFVYFICKWRGNFEKLHFFTLRPKQFFYLTHSAREYFEKLAFEKKGKNETLDGSISKIGENSENYYFQKFHSILSKKRLFFVRSNHMSTELRVLPAYNARWCYQRRDELKELMLRQ